MTTELTPPSSVVTPLSAGQILRQAREQQKLTTAQVAQQLNLSKGLIDDLEQDQVDAKLSSTFVRGYLRSYAKVLKIPAQQVLDAYSNNSKGLHQVPSLTRSFSKRTAKEATENRFIWVTYFVIAVFVVLLVLGFWQNRFGSSASGSVLPMAQTDETMLASEESQPTQSEIFEQSQQVQNPIPVNQLDSSTTPAETAALSTEPQLSLTVDAPVLQVQEPTADPVADSSSMPQNLASEANTSVSEASTPEVSVEETPASVTSESQTLPTADVSANANIKLSLTAECWVDVVDATGKRLVFGSRQAGEELNVRGMAPVKVLLGNAAAATLSFNGEAIDLSGYPTGRVARLTLGQN